MVRFSLTLGDVDGEEMGREGHKEDCKNFMYPDTILRDTPKIQRGLYQEQSHSILLEGGSTEHPGDVYFYPFQV